MSKDLRDEPTGTPPECFLRKTMVRLLDGKEYAVRALPFNRKALGIMSNLVDAPSESKRMEALLGALELGLSYDHSPPEVAAILDAGLIPLMPGPDGTEEGRVHGELMGALLQQAGPKKKGK